MAYGGGQGTEHHISGAKQSIGAQTHCGEGRRERGTGPGRRLSPRKVPSPVGLTSPPGTGGRKAKWQVPVHGRPLQVSRMEKLQHLFTFSPAHHHVMPARQPGGLCIESRTGKRPDRGLGWSRDRVREALRSGSPFLRAPGGARDRGAAIHTQETPRSEPRFRDRGHVSL